MNIEQINEKPNLGLAVRAIGVPLGCSLASGYASTIVGLYRKIVEHTFVPLCSITKVKNSLALIKILNSKN